MQQDINNKIVEYIEIIEKVAKVEYRRIPQHMIDCDELVSIGLISVQALMKGKTEEQLEKYNGAYIATAVRWAIRNELRNRYKWYSLKHKKTDESEDGESSSGIDVSPEKVREAIYETILSIDSIADSSENDSPFDFIRDKDATPDEKMEISELGRIIREAIAKLPAKERTVVEYRFYRNMQVKEIAQQIGLSSSRVTRIVQSSLDIVRGYLKDQGHYDDFKDMC
jgi:RNA polymerase sigma factor (sigma-70 family)